jgi:hypothetical protein
MDKTAVSCGSHNGGGNEVVVGGCSPLYGKGRHKKLDTGKFRDIYPKFDI